MRNRQLAIVTTNRADFYLLENVIKIMSSVDSINFKLIATGGHLANKFGKTLRGIELKGFRVDKKIGIINNFTLSDDINPLLSNTIKKFNRYFIRSKPDLILLLGDRAETAAIAIAARILGIDIAHVYGGEITTGSLDDYFRKIISLLSNYHFVLDAKASERLARLGINNSSIHIIGSLGVENIRTIPIEKVSSLEIKLDLPIGFLKKYAVISLHPVTLESTTVEQQIDFIKDLIEYQEDFNFIISAANNDKGGLKLNSFFKSLSITNKRVFFLENFGLSTYINLCRKASYVIGNSSSLMLEVPSLGVNVINLGDRQNGRTRIDGIINNSYDFEQLKIIINSIPNRDFKVADISHISLPSSQIITSILIEKLNE
jgi:GDP/UDP-N,N'-diacetylbacillosamine 2-epimerase (hydrolysing)